MSKTILITRPRGDEAIFRDELLERGHHVIHEPLMEIVLNHNVRAELEYALFDDPDALLVTSKHGVAALAMLTEIRDLFLLCVGEATANIASQYGFERVSITGETSEHMIQYILDSYDEDAKFLYVSGEDISTDFEQVLGVQGMEVRRVVAYEAVAVQELSDTLLEQIRRGQVDTVTFFSSRTAQIFLNLANKNNIFRELEKIDAFCLSAAIASEISGIKWHKIYIADKPTLASMLSCVDNAYKIA